MKKKRSLLKPLLIAASIPIIVLGLKTAIDIRKGAAGIPANIVIDAVNTHGSSPNTLWQNLGQGGEEMKDMIGPVAPLVRSLQPKLIRIDHLYDYYNVYNGPNNYDFTRLDQVINSILSTGAKPMLSLSYTPSSMAKDNKVANIPNNWSDWNNLITATAHRYSVEKKIDGIYYEVWNEPDLFGGWLYSKDPNYLTLYQNTARAVVAGAGSANYKIGGPATTGFYGNWIKALFQFCTTNHLPLNFISWHRYSKNMLDFDNDFNTLNGILSQYPQYFGVERLITEVGPDSEPNAWYDSKVSGIHLLALVNTLVGKVHRIFPFEIVDGPLSVRNGSTGWGLITNPANGARPKPRFFALKFLNQISGSQLGSLGNGSWVTALATKKDDGTIQVMLVNYDPSGTHSETFPLRIVGLTSGKYVLKRTDYLGSTSSQEITIPSYLYQTPFYLEANSATLLELTHQ